MVIYPYILNCLQKSHIRLNTHQQHLCPVLHENSAAIALHNPKPNPELYDSYEKISISPYFVCTFNVRSFMTLFSRLVFFLRYILSLCLSMSLFLPFGCILEIFNIDCCCWFCNTNFQHCRYMKIWCFCANSFCVYCIVYTHRNANGISFALLCFN